ncbi:UDP-3-O-(3-hydroxymyristoyl)glucosamine N-acyltransferase [Tenacibaculum finnmarkense genomovar ulcerans]|uniref:UDP-3-O-(3-hydroxymyristoyl)glucosamine N-acyltransferase n=1 Tax=Tenacibaculum finnmarkense TaxID=2781243 RepID=UPI0007390C74|nr:UDP-3-O-(3-hydroxymyristoyl)glucosamine N-acyltransferase [Tenacibaculum finnmarkense]ALU74665.1 UDP-3-O-(3-hydroxymyristoyl)glucosamine N-acyltransferase [Tenacibaculum dicentrarchi]MBE7634049.1 UDP-3-O-(3-hydroxymyristoyl)glucosamine N-acyltransferase [Tenacibaculum finnmarkense genomovar ulcerans]MBE7645455.1 UDP-3-O-(3-hydroxymyristoyl)glucosamine N-acyltransferase [Tenacibaculum finnmarkense genomovar ulcerans]MCG8761905.1 UDP-3-O-(3-hydroxymyristoyl)glucosamine N-acyltransferase [Tenac
MKFTAKQIADILEGEIVGNANAEVSKLSKIEEGTTGSLSFLSNSKYNTYIYTTKASVVIVNKSFEPEKQVQATLIKVTDAYASFSQLLEFYNEVKNNKQGRENPHFIADSALVGKQEYIGAFAYIGEHVVLGENVKIYPNSYIGDNVKIGDNTTIFAGVKIYSETQIGKNCKIHSGCVIGSDGFGFAPTKSGEYKAVPQIGNVIIEDHVDIGANATIDRATLGSTIIHKGVKLDNQIQVAHNVEIGENTVIASQTGIAGSAKIGENCMIGGQVGIVGHISIGNNVRIQAKSGIGKSLKDKDVVQGTPAFGYNAYNKSYVYFKNLPKLASKIDKIEKELNAQKIKNE